MQIIPVINCPDLRCVLGKIESARSFLRPGDFVHLDIADGAFTFRKTWSDPRAWRDMQNSFKLEVHLMVEHPKIWIEPWLRAGVKRFIVHVEAIDEHSFGAIAGLCKKGGAEIMLSSNPETSVQKLKPYLGSCSFFQVLCVNPGLAGQKFLSVALEKVAWLKRHAQNATIEVDGGINPETAQLAKDAGADILVSASYIFGNRYVEKAYKVLKAI